jgi:hypothetical protein
MVITPFVKFSFQALHQIDYQNKFVCVRIIYSQLKAYYFPRDFIRNADEAVENEHYHTNNDFKDYYISERFDESMLDFCSPPSIIVNK